MQNWTHIPILAKEAAELLLKDAEGVYLDATLGLGGHAKYFLNLLGTKAQMLGFDKDSKAIEMAVANISDSRLKPFNLSYLDAAEALSELNLAGVNGALFDLGLSSYQLDDASRGFSFLREGPLDMRFDNTKGINAADIVNKWPADKFEDILLKYGDEHSAHKIAMAVFEARREAPLTTTTQLAKVIEKVIPRFGKIHPATKTFQALRIAVNDELNAVESAPKLLESIILPGGRAAFLTFHSTEDRIIKYGLKALVETGNWRLVNKKVIEPDWAEVKQNPRARSAKLRVIERVK